MFNLSRVAAALSLVVCLFAAPAAEASLRKPPGAMKFGPDAVWTDGTTNPLFQPLSDAVPAQSIASMRVSIEMSEDAGFCKMRAALRWSDDGGATWGAVQNPNGATYLSANGQTIGAWVDASTLGTPKQWVQFGVETAEDAGSSAIMLCHATLTVETRA